MTWPLLRAIFLREWAQSLRQPADAAWHALFFVVVSSLFPLSLEPDPDTLRLLAPGVLWVAALLAVLLASGRMFQDDLRSGWVDQWVLTCAATGTPLALLVAARLAAQWLLAALPVLAVAPQFGLGAWPLAVLMASLALGTAVLVLITGVAAALAGGLRGAALLVMLIVLPLVAPAIIFGAMAVHHAVRGQAVGAELALLGAMLAVALVACPLLAAVGLRAAVES